MDVKTTFLNGDIDEVINLVHPENFECGDSKNMVSKLRKSIYGLKQASRQWYFNFYQVIISYGFEANLMDMKDFGEASFVLGVQIHRDRSRGILGLSQRTFIENILQRYGLQNCKPGDTPIA
ncbi:unnamed protein product [Rhodiola kirilowii]